MGAESARTKGAAANASVSNEATADGCSMGAGMLRNSPGWTLHIMPTMQYRIVCGQIALACCYRIMPLEMPHALVLSDVVDRLLWELALRENDCGTQREKK